MTRAPLFSLISLTCVPAFPMIMDASWVTIKHRMWILAEGGAELVAELLGAADVVADELSAPPSPDAPASPSIRSTFSAFTEGEGVEAAVSSTGRDTSMAELFAAVADTVAVEDLSCASFEVAPVLARLCFGCSASEGERDLLRVVSASGMVASSVFQQLGVFKACQQGSRGGKVWGEFGGGDGFWMEAVWKVRRGTREMGGGTMPPFLKLTFTLQTVASSARGTTSSASCNSATQRGRGLSLKSLSSTSAL